LVTHMLCWSWAMCFSAAASSENDHGSMNLASNTAPVPSTTPSRVAAIQRITGWRTQLWTSLMTCPVVRSNQRRLRAQHARLPHQRPQLPAFLDGFARKTPCFSAFLLPRGAPDPGAPPCIRQRFLPLPPQTRRACPTAFWPHSAGSTASGRYYADDRPSSFRLRRNGIGAASGSPIIVDLAGAQPALSRMVALSV
jgi:hypothetical protein